jgi:hypothetical protein
MRVDICGELALWNKNVDEMIHLIQRAQDAGIWTQQEAERHKARLQVLRTELNADFNELVALRERAAGRRLSERNEHPVVKQST